MDIFYSLIKAFVIQAISPLVTSCILLVFALCFFTLKRTRIAKSLVLSSVIWIGIWSQPYAVNLLLYPLEYSTPITETNTDLQPDYIFPLACYYRTEGNISEVSRWNQCSLQRLIEATRLHKKTAAPIIVTGGNFLRDPNVNYAEKATQLLAQIGVQENAIITVGQGTSTKEEIEAIKTLISRKHIWAVTSATHTYRVSQLLTPNTESVLVFSVDYKSNGDLSPFLSIPSARALNDAGKGFYEYIAQIKAKLMD